MRLCSHSIVSRGERAWMAVVLAALERLTGRPDALMFYAQGLPQC
ncbi:MAG: hypothetical protein SWK90_09860 [Chloroflexota bacterium]|nr:hypothetical protein [Chloroflexota bacterium]